jgi:hypothetical protein
MIARYRCAWLDQGEDGYYPLAVVRAGLAEWGLVGTEDGLAVLDATVTEEQAALLAAEPGVEVVGG